MYEDITYESILKRMLSKIPDNMDKREGSIIYDALAPAAVELQLMYIELDVILKETFGDTASRTYLIRRAAERGITPTPATYAVLKGEFTPAELEIPTGSRFSCGKMNYMVTAKISDGVYQMRCETIGEEGNTQFGQMVPINYIDGLQTCYLTEVLIPGEDEEETESIRQRYFDSFDAKAYGGNVADYVQKTNLIDGVGATKVTPVWAGGGTVLLTILSSSYSAASETLVKKVQEEIDPTQDATGLGIAPIGHIVTVETAEEVEININANMTFEDGYSFDNREALMEEALSEYLLELRKNWQSVERITVRLSQIESRLMAIEGVVDVEDLTINGSNINRMLTSYQIPVPGVITNG